MLSEAEKIEALTNLGVELGRVADLDILMERILSEARRFVNADAGSIYIRQNNELFFSYTQNRTLQKRLPKGGKLIYSTFSIPIDEFSIAGFAAKTARILRIADVYQIPLNLPYHFSPSFDEVSGYRTRSMLTVPLVTHRGHVAGVLQVINAKNENGKIVEFHPEDEKMMSHFAGTATVALERARMTRAIILRMIRMAEMRDPKETGAHVNRVGAYSVEIFEQYARKKRLSQKEIDSKKDVFRMAAMMHDVGKVAISDSILKKPARFTPEEFEVMKTHTVHGARLFGDRQSEFDDAAAEVALSHHERWDGNGYPGYVNVSTGKPLPGKQLPDGRAQGKKGKEIPLFGRIVAITDVFDALCSKRIYKPAWEDKDVLSVMEEGIGTQFDPDLMEVFYSNLDILKAIRARYPDEESDGTEDFSKLPDLFW